MKLITINGKEQPIAATRIANLVYTRQFGRKADILEDLQYITLRYQETGAVPIGLLQPILWALLAGGAGLNGFPDYDSWCASNPEFDINEEVVYAAVVEEAVTGFFRGATAGPEKR